jgi:hypothetical protein
MIAWISALGKMGDWWVKLIWGSEACRMGSSATGG